MNDWWPGAFYWAVGLAIIVVRTWAKAWANVQPRSPRETTDRST